MCDDGGNRVYLANSHGNLLSLCEGKLKKNKKFRIFTIAVCALLAASLVESYAVLRLEQTISMSGANIQERIAELDLTKLVDLPGQHNCKKFTVWKIYKYQTCFKGSYAPQEDLVARYKNKAIPHIFNYDYTPPRRYLSPLRIIDEKTYFHGGRPFARSYGRIFANGTWDVRIRESYLNWYSGVDVNEYPASSAGSTWKIVKQGVWK